jgi:quercetin dioxygenase-like cupin family protein
MLASFRSNTRSDEMPTKKQSKPIVTHATDGFAPGFRDYLRYRDLGVVEPSGGRFSAQVLRAAHAFSGGTGRHHHVLEFQLVYVISGSLKFWLDGEGEVTLAPGSSLYLPSGTQHDLLAADSDAVWIEITSPAEFPTI